MMKNVKMMPIPVKNATDLPLAKRTQSQISIS